MRTDTVDERRVLVRGLSTSYLEAGVGPVLLLVHGNLTTFRSWRRIVAQFQSTHRVLAVSLPGYGGTSPQPDVELDSMVSFLADFLDVLSIDEAIVLGHSSGGLIAATFALRNPGRVTRLVLADSAGLGRAVTPFAVAAALAPTWVENVVISALLLPGGNIALALLGALQLRRPWRVSLRESVEQSLALQARTVLFTSYRTVRMAIGPAGQRPRYNIVDRLGELRMPTLVIWGVTDDVFPVWQAVRAVRKLPRGRLALLIGGGHIGFLDSHVEFIDFLSPFIRDELDVPPNEGDDDRVTERGW
ncbi:alpha/beta hydrolase [Actinosynnema sp. NPDC047251]|uniref:Alpha/beta hydrolase fold containing protein n=1 Tax=Saccharothrix espanaensis (strain ATCC 51144 / DSM 44229 / JCM 9112 / NBRC 15066 / NRRL 15764) TaxID=1179773 RepID=K0K2A4_SACES|nr:alpha/beta hydrolase [Saccharothrix espanaensis]CCH30668.1 alpha/beta hydrolase fold containing protein [Saccharothrix espanaensis DSM 44229]